MRRTLQFGLLLIAVLWVLVPKGGGGLAPAGLTVGMCPEDGIDYLQRGQR